MPTTTTIEPGELRERREHLGIARLELAARAGCSLTTVANIEAGVVPQRSAVLPRIIEALDEIERERCALPNDRGPAASEPSGKTGTDDAHISA